MSFSAVRIAAGYSLDDVCQEFCVSLAAVLAWEDGRTQPPQHIIGSLDLIRSFAAAASSDIERGATDEPGEPLRAARIERAAPLRGGETAISSTLDALPTGLIRSRQRVADHGEVFTPPWLVEKMLDLVKGESERIDSRFLEPACGSGNFLVPVLQRKLAAVERAYGKSEFEKRHHALQALTCIYGIELLADNIAECRAKLLEVFAGYLGLAETDELCRAASQVLSLNLIHGDAMTMRAADGSPITVVEWGYIGRGKFQRRDFRLDVLTGMAGFREDGSLFAHLGQHEIFTPTDSYAPMTVPELAAADVAGVAHADAAREKA